ncbi:hypothetical protein VTJ49DRAFT_4936 [Mycothermus thermophilus]|uniref:Mitochondrial carrier protein n=1 Tax=Humicola insolens TaxID=85995 RepID=A0ABR3VR55_HUMIN
MSADFWAGYISGAASIILGNPLDVLKVRLQAGFASSSSSPKPPAPHSPSYLAAHHPLTPTTTPTTSFATSYIRPFLLGTAAPVLGYGALNALLFVSYNRTEAFLNRYLASPNNNSSSVLAQDNDDGFQTRGTNLLTTWLAGAAGGLATWVVSAPTELVKCRAQLEIPAQSLPTSTATAATAAAASAAASVLPHSTPAPQQQQQKSPPSATSLSIARSILRTHGLRGLYFGGGVTAVRDSVGYGFYFWGYELCSRWMTALTSPGPGADGPNGDSGSASGGSIWTSDAARVLLCGGLAGIITWASIFPLDVVKTRMQAQPDVFLPPRGAGESAPLLGGDDGRRSGVEGGQQQQQQQQQRRQPRLSAWAVAKDTYREGGTRAFFRGLGVCSARAFVVNAVQWAVYEWIMAELGQGRRKQQQVGGEEAVVFG